MDATMIVEIDEVELPCRPRCPACGTVLKLSQPDEEVPNLLTGCCGHCRAGYLVIAPPDDGMPAVGRRLWSIAIDKRAPGEAIAV
jgi:hypothetical protein